MRRPEVLDAIETAGFREFEAEVWRHMFNRLDPARANTRGARWNPRGVSAIYTSLERETALAEAEYAISVQPLRPSVSRQMHRIKVTLDNLVDLSDLGTLGQLGINSDVLSATNYLPSQEVGEAAQWMGADGLLVPSARAIGQNLVLFVDRLDIDARFDVIQTEVLQD